MHDDLTIRSVGLTATDLHWLLVYWLETRSGTSTATAATYADTETDTADALRTRAVKFTHALSYCRQRSRR